MTAVKKFVPQIEVTRTETDYVVSARSAFGSLYVAYLPVCNCGLDSCAGPERHKEGHKLAAVGCRGGLDRDRFCHRGPFTGWHSTHVDAFVTTLAKTYKAKPNQKVAS